VLERQKRFTQLESDIADLNAMFKDLAVMVHDQGEIISI
jgi:t-SNARE complex subunit (syntaxin)